MKENSLKIQLKRFKKPPNIIGILLIIVAVILAYTIHKALLSIALLIIAGIIFAVASAVDDVKDKEKKLTMKR